MSPESELLKDQLEENNDGGNPFEKEAEGEIETLDPEEDEDDDGLALDFIERVQKERTS